ncbi:MAG: phosphotransacetylase family protein [Bacillota bacterium]|nr:phosphotransacetylase family protein [Bacillota bacterium]
MKAIYFSGKAGGGQTATALGIGLKLRKEGLKVSYFKPLGFRKGSVRKDDEDVILMREVFGLPFASDIISPVTINRNYLTAHFPGDKDNVLNKLKSAYKTLSDGYDVVLIDGIIEPYVGHNQGLDDFNLAKVFDSVVLPIIKADDDFQLDLNMLYLDLWNINKLKILGTVFSNVSQVQMNKCTSVYKPMLEGKGISVLGITPYQPILSAPTVTEFYDVLNGEILASPDHMNRIVEEVVVGTMTIESALGYLRRAPNKALVTGGDRSDLALTALETSTSVIIFTGGLYPDVRVLSRAEEKGVPVILVHEDTFSTLENLHRVYWSINPDNKEAIKLVEDTIDKYVDWKSILKYLKK